MCLVSTITQAVVRVVFNIGPYRPMLMLSSTRCAVSNPNFVVHNAHKCKGGCSQWLVVNLSRNLKLCQAIFGRYLCIGYFYFLFFSFKPWHTEYVSGKNDLEMADAYTDISAGLLVSAIDGQILRKSFKTVDIMTETSVRNRGRYGMFQTRFKRRSKGFY